MKSVTVIVLLFVIGVFAMKIPIPPELPLQFSGDFVEYSAPLTNPPPYVNGIPGAPFIASRGKVYYDWNKQAMIEVRLDYCVNIFPTGQNFTCTFFNVNQVSYLISDNSTGDSPFPPCCVFGKPWHPPRPSFLRTDAPANFAGMADWGKDDAIWFIIPTIDPPTGPFYYAFANDSSPQVYLSFSFPGIQGWVQQNFENIQVGPFDESVFDLPEICQNNVPSCNFPLN